jgi:monovalent cation/hydrogen antiporter
MPIQRIEPMTRSAIVLLFQSAVTGALLVKAHPSRRELSAARERALRAGLASFARDRSPIAEVVRQEFTARLAYERPDADADDATHSAHSEIYRGALQAARQAVLAMRANDEIGDAAFHRMEEELDWLEMAGGRKGE